MSTSFLFECVKYTYQYIRFINIKDRGNTIRDTLSILETEFIFCFDLLCLAELFFVGVTFSRLKISCNKILALE